jgi:hypothetical protein
MMYVVGRLKLLRKGFAVLVFFGVFTTGRRPVLRIDRDDIFFMYILPLAHECRQQPSKKKNPTTHKRPPK